jgi:hypothetical protein
MIKSRKNLELKTLDDVINYMKGQDTLLIRNVEGNKPLHWIENYFRMTNGEPQKVKINEELFFECFKDISFYSSPIAPIKKNEFHYIYNESFEEDF